MDRFWNDLINPLFIIKNVKSIVEIGSQSGSNTKNILQYCVENNANLTCIDPYPLYDPIELNVEYGNRMTFHKELSLNVLGLLDDYDAILIDGDHNWYTVYNELKQIEKTFSKKDKFPLIIAHDTSWPYDRRDLYYNPDNIPDVYRHPYQKKGILPGVVSLIEDDKASINSHLCNSIYVNNLRNGVLTAIEDFLRESDRKLNFIDFKSLHGIAVVFTDDDAVSAFLTSSELYSNIIKLTEKCRLEAIVAANGHQLNVIKNKEIITQLSEKSQQLQEVWEKSQIELIKLKEQLFTETKICDELKNNNREIEKKYNLIQFELNSKINHIENSIRYRIGESFINAAGSFDATLKLPFRLLRLFREAKSKTSKNMSLVASQHETAAIVPLPGAKTTAKDLEQHLKKLEAFKGGKNAVVDVIVCVHNALDDVKICLCSLYEKKTLHFNLIVVDDGSDNETHKFLKLFTKRFNAKFIRNETSKGYTCAANQGLKTATSNYVVLLNSDTIVTRSWLEKLISCMDSTPNTGIVGPLSNAASWQTVPEIFDGGDWKVNTLPKNITLEMMAAIVEKSSAKAYISVPFINGFCFMIKRDVINKIGYLDEITFPMGYGEENDYCIRAHNAGFELRIVDDCYISHEKSKSFTHEKRKILSKKASELLLNKYNAELINKKVDELKHSDSLMSIRDRISDTLGEVSTSDVFNKKILFLLTVGGGGGGSHSVLQEVIGLNELGIDVKIANYHKNKDVFLREYPESDCLIEFFTSQEQLLDICRKYDIVVATIFSSVKLLSKVKQVYPNIIACYYIQDYEPYFFDDSQIDKREEATASYSLIPNINGFAKTNWLCDIVNEKHGLDVRKVIPSLDTTVYNPFYKRISESKVPIIISAMVRPKTPRRRPYQTLALLHRLKKHYDDKVEIRIFGCENNDIQLHPKYNDFKFINYGRLKRTEVVSLLDDADIFVDMSEYQAFGRTGLEAMAMGCATVLPVKGGTKEYCEDGINCFLVDTNCEDDVFDAVCKVIDSPDLMLRIKSNSLLTAQIYSVRKTAYSEYLFFDSLLAIGKI